MTKWKPKDDLIGVPGKGYIKAEDFKEEDLQALIKRAKNRKADVHTFLLGCGLVPNSPQMEIEMEDASLHTEVVEEKPKRKRRTKAEMEASE